MRPARILASLVLGSLAVLVLPNPAAAAVCANWDPPDEAVAGSNAAVSFRTLVPISTGGDSYRLEPHAFPRYPFHIQTLAPSGSVEEIAMAPSADDKRVWLGSVAPTAAGSWRLVISNLTGSDPECYADATLVVDQAPTGTSAAWFVGVLVLVGVVGTLLYVLVSRRQSRR
jgi:hypothetical protein